MPPAKKRNEFVFLVDAQADTKFMRDALDKIITYKSLHGSLKVSNDLFRLVLINYPKPPNNYVLCNSLKSMPMGNDTLFKLLDANLQKKPDIPAQCDWIKAIEYASHLFDVMAEDKYVQTFILVLISDFVTVSQLSDPGQCIENLIDMDIRFVAVVNQDITYEVIESILTPDDAKNAMKGIRIPEGNANMEVLCEVAATATGIVTGPKNMLNFLALFENFSPKQEWRVSLTLAGYAFATLTRKILESRGNLVRTRRAKKNYQHFKRPGDLAEADASTAGIDLEAVSKEDVVIVRLYHGQPVYISRDIYHSFKANNSVTFKIIGFVIPSQLPEFYYGGADTYAIVANKSHHRAEHFVELVATMKRLNRLAIAVRIYTKATAEKLFVLTPMDGWMLMQKLSDGVHQVVCPETEDVAQEVDESKLKPEMLAMRHHLLAAGKRSLFHPTASLNVHHRAIVENVRNVAGYNTQYCCKEEILSEMSDIGDGEIKQVLDKLFQEPAEEDPSATAPVMDDKMDDDSEEW